MSTPFHTPFPSNKKEENSLERLGYHIQEVSSTQVEDKNISHSIQKMLAEGYSLLQAKRIQEAGLMADVCLNMDPKCSHIWSLKGDCLIEQKNFSAALDCYQKALELDPKSPIDLFKMAYFKEKFTPKQTTLLEGKVKKLVLMISVLASILFGALGLFWTFQQKSTSLQVHSNEKYPSAELLIEPFRTPESPNTYPTSTQTSAPKYPEKNESKNDSYYPIHQQYSQGAPVNNNESVLPLPLSDAALQWINTKPKSEEGTLSPLPFISQSEQAPAQPIHPSSDSQTNSNQTNQKPEDNPETIQKSEPVSTSCIVDIHPSPEETS